MPEIVAHALGGRSVEQHASTVTINIVGSVRRKARGGVLFSGMAAI